jgi:hypothetical protein
VGFGDIEVHFPVCSVLLAYTSHNTSVISVNLMSIRIPIERLCPLPTVTNENTDDLSATLFELVSSKKSPILSLKVTHIQCSAGHTLAGVGTMTVPQHQYP